MVADDEKEMRILSGSCNLTLSWRRRAAGTWTVIGRSAACAARLWQSHADSRADAGYVVVELA